MWAMFPILVYGYDSAADQYRVAAAEWRRLAGLLPSRIQGRQHQVAVRRANAEGVERGGGGRRREQADLPFARFAGQTGRASLQVIHAEGDLQPLAQRVVEVVN